MGFPGDSPGRAGDTGWIPDQEDTTCQGATKPVLRNCCPSAREPQPLKSVLQLLKPEHPGARAPPEKPPR